MLNVLISYHVHTIRAWLRVVVSNTCGVVFLFCFSLSCVTCVASFSGVSICDRPFGIP
jgi:hypothetical protein